MSTQTEYESLKKDDRLVHLWGRSVGSSVKHNNPMIYSDCAEAILRINEIICLEENCSYRASDIKQLYRNLKQNAAYHKLNFHNPYETFWDKLFK